MSLDDQSANRWAVEKSDGRIFSSYKLDGEMQIWVITEADRSSTTILLPDEY